jgi:hypothetical protein
LRRRDAETKRRRDAETQRRRDADSQTHMTLRHIDTQTHRHTDTQTLRHLDTRLHVLSLSEASIEPRTSRWLEPVRRTDGFFGALAWISSGSILGSSTIHSCIRSKDAAPKDGDFLFASIQSHGGEWSSPLFVRRGVDLFVAFGLCDRLRSVF